MDVRVGLQRKLSAGELMLLNWGVGKDFWESLDCKEIQTVLRDPKRDQSWVFTRRSDAEAETPILWPPDAKNWLIGKDPDAGKDWRWEKGTTEWDGWMASPTQWTWVWVNSGGWWWTGRPGVLQSIGSQKVGHNWVTELNWTQGKDFPGGSDGKASAYKVGDLGSIPGWGRSSGEGNGNPLHTLTWKIPSMEDRGRLQSMGSQRVRHNWVTSRSLFTFNSKTIILTDISEIKCILDLKSY